MGGGKWRPIPRYMITLLLACSTSTQLIRMCSSVIIVFLSVFPRQNVSFASIKIATISSRRRGLTVDRVICYSRGIHCHSTKYRGWGIPCSRLVDGSDGQTQHCFIQWRHSLLTRVDKVQGPPRSKGPPSATCKNLCQ